MNMQNTESTTKVLKETKKKIQVEFDRTDRWTRFKIKFFSTTFLTQFVFGAFRFLLMLGVSYVILQPFFSKIASSFMSAADFVDVSVKFIPKYPTLDTYKAIFVDNHYMSAFLNTFLLSLMCALLQTFVCCMIGYGLSKFKFRGSKILFALVVLTMIVPHNTLRLSMVMKFRFFDILGIFKLLGGGVYERFAILPFSSINLNNSYWPLALLSMTGLAFKNGLYIFMMRQFFHNVPNELEESAYIDGSGVFKTFLTIVLPLSIPMMVTVFLFAFSWQWTDNFYTRIFFTNSTGIRLMPSVVGIPKSLDTNYAGQTMYEAAIRNTCGLMIISPLIIVYLFCQKFLVQGIERSGIVG